MGGGTDGVEIRRPAILHLHTEPAWGGGENQVLQLLKGLTQSGYGVSLVALPESPLATRCRQEGLDCRPVEMASDLDLLGAARIARLARQGGFHILHAHTARAHALGLLARYMGAPCRLVVSRRLSVPISGHLLGRLKYRSRRVDLYLAVARTVQSILMEAGIQAQRIQVVHSCIDLTPFDAARSRRPALRAQVRKELDMPAAAPLVGNTAALVDCKSQIDLVNAFPSVLEAVPGAHLLIAGEGEQRQRLESRIQALDLRSRIHLLGFRKDVPRLLASLDVFVMSSSLEGFCNSVLEAFAMEVPVVSTRAGALPEMVSDGTTGLLAPVHDPPALASAMVRLLRHRNLGARLAAASRRLVETEYTVKRMLTQTCTAYARLLSSRPVP